MTNRRTFITGLISFAATAPAIVRAGSLMPVKVMLPDDEWRQRAMIDAAQRLVNPPMIYGQLWPLPRMCWRDLQTGEVSWQ